MSGIDRGLQLRVIELLENRLSAPAIIYGSLPPGGHDLDLLVRPRQDAEVAAAMLELGAVRRRNKWAVIEPGRAYIIDLTPARRWALSGAAEVDLFASAVPLRPDGQLVRPAPHHELLILARRVRRNGCIDDVTRVRVAAASAASASAWADAESWASAWGVTEALRQLALIVQSQSPLPVESRRPSGLRLRGRLAARRRRGRVVALSGVDGAGKSTVARATVLLLAQLGVDAEPVWTSVKHEQGLGHLGTTIRRRRVKNSRPALRIPAGKRGEEGRTSRIGLRLFLWTTVLAVANARTHRERTAPSRHQGRIVLCDRYVLDTTVQLRYLYGTVGMSIQTWLNRRLSPRPLAAYLLDLDADEALRRKPEKYSPAQMRTLVALYRENAAATVQRLDATQSPNDLAVRIATDVWLTR